MLRNRKIILFVPLCFIIILILGISTFALRRPSQSFVTPQSNEYETVSNRHTQVESENIRLSNLGTDGYVCKLENERLAVWYREEICGIRIVDKKTGYVWGTIEADKVEGLNNSWSATANALCVFEYFDSKFNAKKLTISDSNVKLKEDWSSSDVVFKVQAKKADISFEFKMSLTEDGLLFQVDDSTIEEDGDCLLKSISFIPFMGAVYQDSVSGYIFIPDGCGALMRFAKSSNYVGGYSQRIYGLDTGIDQMTQINDLVSTRTNDYLIEGTSVSVPVFGVVHGAEHNALMSVVNSGAEYAQIEAIPAGVVTDYNRISCVFNYRQIYTHPVGGSASGVLRPQAEKNSVNAAISIHLLANEEASYSGMAVKYRQMLIDEKQLASERVDKEIPLRLDVVGSEVAKGQLFDYAKTFTTIEQASEMVKSLSENNIENISLFYQGWQKGGLSGASYGETSYNRKLGNQKSYSELSEILQKQGGYFYLYENVLTGNEEQLYVQTDVAQQISKEYEKYSRSNKEAQYTSFYVAKANKLLNVLEERENKKDNFGRNFGELGYRLYSDYTRSSEYTRIEFQNELVSRVSKQQDRVAFYAPNDYLWKYTDDYLNMPMNNSQYLYETDTVPFLQIVLKGSVDYYASYANQSAYTTADILKMIEYGTYPSFIVAYADNFELQDTPLEDYFSINFKDWETTIVDVYKQVSEALNEVEGAYIVNHKVLETGMIRVDYSSGTSIYINYNNTECNVDGVTIPAESYLVKESGGNEKEK